MIWLVSVYGVDDRVLSDNVCRIPCGTYKLGFGVGLPTPDFRVPWDATAAGKTRVHQNRQRIV